ncbi:MAG: hypothetical protein IPM49_03670 [Flavobacteriales bacterium]|nr:hypothetical protein [Flavobacteriales bacterium]
MRTRWIAPPERGTSSHPVVARRYSDSQRANFDIYLPEWLARHNKTIYSVIMGAVLVGMVWRLVG